MRRPLPATTALLCTAAMAATACVRAPDVAVVDSRTALEVQAAGEFPPLEAELAQASLQPGGEAIPREALATSDEAATLGTVVRQDAEPERDDERLDAWLVAACVGEGLDGLLAVRPEGCRAQIDEGEVARLVGRENVHRRQTWAALAAREGTTEEAVRAVWRPIHLERVVCGGLVETSAGRWEPKPC